MPYLLAFLPMRMNVLYMFVNRPCCCLLLFVYCCLFIVVSVAPTEPIKLSVSKVTREQYNRLHSNIQELRRSGTCTYLLYTC